MSDETADRADAELVFINLPPAGSGLDVIHSLRTFPRVIVTSAVSMREQTESVILQEEGEVQSEEAPLKKEPPPAVFYDWNSTRFVEPDPELENELDKAITILEECSLDNENSQRHFRKLLENYFQAIGNCKSEIESFNANLEQLKSAFDEAAESIKSLEGMAKLFNMKKLIISYPQSVATFLTNLEAAIPKSSDEKEKASEGVQVEVGTAAVTECEATKEWVAQMKYLKQMMLRQWFQVVSETDVSVEPRADETLAEIEQISEKFPEVPNFEDPDAPVTIRDLAGILRSNEVRNFLEFSVADAERLITVARAARFDAYGEMLHHMKEMTSTAIATNVWHVHHTVRSLSDYLSSCDDSIDDLRPKGLCACLFKPPIIYVELKSQLEEVRGMADLTAIEEALKKFHEILISLEKFTHENIDVFIGMRQSLNNLPVLLGKVQTTAIATEKRVREDIFLLAGEPFSSLVGVRDIREIQAPVSAFIY